MVHVLLWAIPALVVGAVVLAALHVDTWKRDHTDQPDGREFHP